MVYQVLMKKYGPNSLCILNSLAPSDYTSERVDEGHKIICNYDKLTFNVDIGDVEVECLFDYEEINVDGYTRSLICPGFDRVLQEVFGVMILLLVLKKKMLILIIK